MPREIGPRRIVLGVVAVCAAFASGGLVARITRPTVAAPAGLSSAASAAASNEGPSRDAWMLVDCAAPARPISPLIYGIARESWGTGMTARRIGGNPATRLNWDLGDAWNTGSDWFFENVEASPSLVEMLADDAAHGVRTALVVPMIGWVAKDRTSVGFPVSKRGKQHAVDPGRPEAGDGLHPDGSPLDPGPAETTSVAAPPETIRGWITTLRQRDPGRRAVDEYILDNEPSLWEKTHRDVHPEPVGYDELLDRTIRYATAIRQADPDAVIAGPAEWGWTSFFYSAADVAARSRRGADRARHGGEPLLLWYLKRLAEHEKETGTRLLDVVDVHFYPQAEHVYGGDAGTDADTAALRIRSTRALWDPDYRDESWIQEPVRLVPRIRAWIAEGYPGRGISIGEWSFGAETHPSGGLAIAEALGRFAEQGVTSAFYWRGPDPGTPAFWAFRAFRNFDGKGGRFLDLLVPARGAPGLSLFASRDARKTRVVAVVLNLDPGRSAQASIDLASCSGVTSRRSFVYAPGSPGFVDEGVRADNGVIDETIPPYSMKVLDIALGGR